MMEARVVCLANQVLIRDLMITLNRGDVELIPEARARASRDLDDAKRMGLVSIEYVKRFREVRSAAAPEKKVPSGASSVAWNQRPQRLYHRGRLLNGKEPAEEPVTQPLNEGAIRAIVAEELRAQIQTLKNDLIGHLVAHMDDLRQDVRVLLERTSSALVDEVVSKVGVREIHIPVSLSTAEPGSAVPVRKEIPLFEEESIVFIPQGIVSGEEPRLRLESEKSEEPSGFDDAARALRSMKRQRKAEPRKGHEET